MYIQFGVVPLLYLRYTPVVHLVYLCCTSDFPLLFPSCSFEVPPLFLCLVPEVIDMTSRCPREAYSRPSFNPFSSIELHCLWQNPKESIFQRLYSYTADFFPENSSLVCIKADFPFPNPT